MKTVDIGFERFEADFYADINTMYVKLKEEDCEKYMKIIKPTNKHREEFLKNKKPLVMAAWERYVEKTNQLNKIIRGNVMDNTIRERLEQWVRDNYKKYSTGWTWMRSEGNSCDCFNDGCEHATSWAAYEVGCILGMDLEEPDEPDYDEF